MYITHITKVDFLCAFKEAFFTAFIDKNIQGAFAGAGLILHNPGRVLSKMTIRLRTPTPPASPNTALPWLSQTPQNAREATSQKDFIKGRIYNHQGSSPTPMLAAVDQLAKSTMAVMHEVALLRTEVSALRKANEDLSRRAKKTRIRLGGSLTVQQAQDELDQKAVGEQLAQEIRQSRSGAGGARTKIRCCVVCGKPGHNARTCQGARELPKAYYKITYKIIVNYYILQSLTFRP